MDKLAKSENLNPKDIKLSEGEKVVWTGQPEMRLFSSLDWIRIPFSIVWLSVAIFIAFQEFYICGTPQALKSGGSFFVVWTLMIASIGTFAIVGPFIQEYQLRKKTRFILTNKRAISKNTWLNGWEKSCELVGLEDIREIADKNDKGVIFFEDLPQYQLLQWKWSPALLAKRSKSPVFFDLPNVDKIFRLAQDINKGSSGQKSITPAAEDLSSRNQGNSELRSAGTITSGPWADYLRPEEKLLWQGKPDQNINLLRKPELIEFFTLIVTATAFSLFGCFLIYHLCYKPAYCLLAWLFSFVLVFLVAMIQERSLRKNIHYAVSDQRVMELINIGYGQTFFKYAEINNLRNMIKSSYNDGAGGIYFIPPAKGLLAAIFGQEAAFFTNLNPMLRKEPVFLLIDKPDAIIRLIRDLRQKKGLGDIPKLGNLDRSIAMVANASLKRISKERHISGATKAKLLLFNQQTATACIPLAIMSVFSCVAFNMLANVNWAAKTSNYDSGGFMLFWVTGVLSICSISFIFVISHFKKRWHAIHLLKTGVRAQGTRLPDERVLLMVNHSPAICERNYEFSVNGTIYQLKSITSFNQPRHKQVTIAFDPINPDQAVVLDDLPGCPIISDDDMSVEYSEDQIPAKN